MCDAEFHYTYEYQGNAAKLVHTPLTDKCYLTLTQGMHMGLGGNPYGPAGTGKTESVKALGGLFGRQVLVFNCDEVGIRNKLNFEWFQFYFESELSWTAPSPSLCVYAQITLSISLGKVPFLSDLPSFKRQR